MGTGISVEAYPLICLTSTGLRFSGLTMPLSSLYR
jgi:hypothetical protein